MKREIGSIVVMLVLCIALAARLALCGFPKPWGLWGATPAREYKNEYGGETEYYCEDCSSAGSVHIGPRTGRGPMTRVVNIDVNIVYDTHIEKIENKNMDRKSRQRDEAAGRRCHCAEYHCDRSYSLKGRYKDLSRAFHPSHQMCAGCPCAICCDPLATLPGTEPR